MTIDAQGRVEPPLAAGEPESLLGFLDYHRETFAWKVSGLGAEALRRTTAASTMTLGGMIKHLALVEESWCSRRLHGRPLGSPWEGVDWVADPDWDWHSADENQPQELIELWRASVESSRVLVDEALQVGGLEQLAVGTLSDGARPSLRWILLHLIEEYARHNGHADLLREAIDGQTGE